MVGNDLFFVQEGFFIRPREFTILEYYKIETNDIADSEETIVFGILAPYYHIKGILLNHYKAYSTVTPPVLVKKLNEFNILNGVGM